MISVDYRKRNPNMPFTGMKRQWKRKRKNCIFLSKQCLETQVMAYSGFRNGILQFSMLTEKNTHIFALPPAPPIRSTNGEDRRLI